MVGTRPLEHPSSCNPDISTYFNIFMYDLFLILNELDFSNYVDDRTLFASGNTLIENIVS